MFIECQISKMNSRSGGAKCAIGVSIIRSEETLKTRRGYKRLAPGPNALTLAPYDNFGFKNENSDIECGPSRTKIFSTKCRN
jgi:hypothetical protein